MDERLILTDASVWIDHLRNGHTQLRAVLDEGRVLMHPYVLGELALGSLAQRSLRLESMSKLPQAPVASPSEILAMIEGRRLWGLGVGYVDAHLLGSALVLDDAALLTRDKRLSVAAERIGVDLF